MGYKTDRLKSSTPRFQFKWMVVFFFSLFLFGDYVFPFPMIREAEDAKRQKIELEVAIRSEQEQKKQDEENKKNEAAIQAADESTIKNLIRQCRDNISDYLYDKNKPFGHYFTNYSPEDLSHSASLFSLNGRGFPSSWLDKYDGSFNIIDYNLKKITAKKKPSRQIEFVVEGAQDGFTTRQYVAIYICFLHGLEVGSPIEGSKYIIN